MSNIIEGIGVARGIAIGRAHKIHGNELEIRELALRPADIEAECERYTAARQQAKVQLREIRDRIPDDTPRDIASFIDTHLLMLDDRTLSDAVTDHIRSAGCNAEWALKKQGDGLIRVFDTMDDAYLASRRDDVEHVVTRIQRILLRDERVLAVADAPEEPAIVVADDVTPADVILLHQQGVAGFITEFGGPLSHTAILARSLAIPAIVGAHDARQRIADGDPLLIDGKAGIAITAPSEAQRADFAQRQAEHRRFHAMLEQLRDVPAVTRDGQAITLLCNVELPNDTALAHGVGAAGVGLYRTEFLYMNRPDTPDEDEQYQAYLNVIQAVSGPITIRTLDLGADKQVDSGRLNTGPTPNNPALGLRAIRLCLKDEPLFRVQLRALLRAAAHGPVKIMLPMISNLDELLRARALIEDTKRELAADGLRFDAEVQVGAMIEIPAAALAARHLAQHADFFSIGTNDLIQYTLAIDRVDDEVNYLYDPLHPAVLRLIWETIVAGGDAGIPVSMCGEMAGDTRFTRLLLALGLREFSMHPNSVLEVKQIILESDMEELKRQGQALVDTADPDEVRRLIAALTT